ncbi:MAG: hypothetical protein KDA22_00600 [Phycisphaerales bacterium]|nr:hypothetical protein [Phycisphaerales bacterium]
MTPPFHPTTGRWISFACQATAALLVLGAIGFMIVIEDKSKGVLAAVLAVITVRFLVLGLAEWAHPTERKQP